MRALLAALCASTAMLGASTSAMAVDIGGLAVPAGPTFSVAQIYTNAPTSVGSTLSAYGKVDSINSQAVSTLCVGCELTFHFTGYTVTSISPTEIKFTGGAVQFYLGFGADADFSTGNAGGSAGDLVEATNGTLFLSLLGHPVDAAGNTLVGTGVNIGTTSPTGFASGLWDVNTGAGGIANGFFNSDTIPALFGGPADFQFGSSFSALNPLYPGECPGGPACLRGSADFTGSIGAVPEPSAWALMVVGFMGLGAAIRRMRRTLVLAA